MEAQKNLTKKKTNLKKSHKKSSQLALSSNVAIGFWSSLLLTVISVVVILWRTCLIYETLPYPNKSLLLILNNYSKKLLKFDKQKSHTCWGFSLSHLVLKGKWENNYLHSNKLCKQHNINMMPVKPRININKILISQGKEAQCNTWGRSWAGEYVPWAVHLRHLDSSIRGT